MDEQGAPDKNSNVKREHRRAGSEDRWLEYRGMGLAKPKPTWGLIRWGTCRSASCSHSDVTAGRRLWKMWACCWMGQGTWRQRTRKRMQYLEPSSTLVLADKISLQEPQVPDTSGKVEQEGLTSVEEDQVREHLKKLGIHESMGSDQMHSWVRRQRASLAVRPLLVIFERSWWSGEVPEDWKNIIDLTVGWLTLVFCVCLHWFPVFV